MEECLPGVQEVLALNPQPDKAAKPVLTLLEDGFAL